MDEKIFLILYNIPHPIVLTFIVSIISALGSYGFIWLVMAFYYFGKVKNGIFKYVLSFLFFSVFIFFLQKIFGRMRPYEVLDNVSYLGFIDPGGFSFPSYHAAVSFFSAYLFGTVFKKIKNRFYLLAIIISFSRLYLGAHYLTDILAGAIIGMILGSVVMKYGGCKNR